MNNCEFNIQSETGTFICPVCGFPNFSRLEAYDKEEGGKIGTTICPCCLWEPGFDDNQLASAEAKATILQSVLQYRANWQVTSEWRGQKNLRPEDWNPASQLDELFKRAPFLT